MGVQDRIAAAVRDAAVSGTEEPRLPTLRLIQAAIRDRDIALRREGDEVGVTEEEVREILERMAAQRRESARAYEAAARLEQAEAKLAELAVIEEFLPRPLNEAEVEAAIGAAVDELGAGSIRDLGRVMALLKRRYAGRIDPLELARRVKARLG